MRFDLKRCNVCNCVSSHEIASDYGEAVGRAFFEDTTGFGYLCHECYEEINEVRTDFDIEDELDENDDGFYFHEDD